jgi:hypothetical protein
LYTLSEPTKKSQDHPLVERWRFGVHITRRVLVMALSAGPAIGTFAGATPVWASTWPWRVPGLAESAAIDRHGWEDVFARAAASAKGASSRMGRMGVRR